MDLSQPQTEEDVSSNKVNRVGNKQRDLKEESRYIMDDLKSVNFILFLQETPKVKMSRCQVRRCMPRKRTGKPVIKSHYRFMLKDISEPLITGYKIS